MSSKGNNLKLLPWRSAGSAAAGVSDKHELERNIDFCICAPGPAKPSEAALMRVLLRLANLRECSVAQMLCAAAFA